jgi:trans-2,3-dihydro-3-hydroxyanthranilate isomerase
MRYHFYTCDVFTGRRFGGNPLAVFPDARGLDTPTMQLMTREINYSESTFVFPPETPGGTRRVRIFTPGAEMPFAGHPTVGTAFVLAAIGDLPLTGERTRVVFEEGVGPVPVSIFASAGRVTACQLSAARMPEYGPEPPPSDALAEMLGLQPADILGGDWAPQSVSCGIPFLFIPQRDRAAVARAALRSDLWHSLLGGYWTSEVYIFALGGELPGSDLRARTFAPRLGVPEDPATGAAATALAGYLGPRDARQDGALRWVVEQGFEMGRPSILEVEADKVAGEITAIRVGGSAVMVSEGWMEV